MNDFELAPEPTPEPTPAPAPEPEGQIVVPTPDEAPKTPAYIRMQRKIVRWFDARQLGGARGALIGAGLALLAGACFAISHAGIAGVLGLLAAFMLWVAQGPIPEAHEGTRPPRPFVHLLTGAADLCLVGGVALEGAAAGSVWRVLVAVLVLGLLMLLPRAERTGGRASGNLWSPDERRLVLLISAMVGHTTLPLFLIVVVGSVDLCARLLASFAALKSPPPAEFLPPALRALYLPDGRAHPGVRIALALAMVLLLVLLPAEAGWRF